MFCIQDRSNHLCYIYFVVCKCFQFGKGKVFVVWEWVKGDRKKCKSVFILFTVSLFMEFGIALRNCHIYTDMQKSFQEREKEARNKKKKRKKKKKEKEAKDLAAGKILE